MRLAADGERPHPATSPDQGAVPAAPEAAWEQVTHRGPAGPSGGPSDADDSSRVQPGRGAAAVTGAAYGMLLLLGFTVGVYGAFYYSLSVWSVPVGALVAVAVIFIVCRAAGRLLRTRPAALLPAVGWLVAVVLLSAQRPEGDLLITSSTAGYVLLFGGAVAAAVAVTMSFLDRTGPREGRTGVR